MSLRLHLLTGALRLFVKPGLARATGPEANRRLLEHGRRWLFRAPPFALFRETVLTPDVRALWISVRPGTRPAARGKCILYFHGGGFHAGAPETHAPMLARLSRAAGIEVCAPAWRYAPEHPYPAGLEDARRAWVGLLARGYRSSDIVLAGDSAGGNLALVLLSELCATGTRPAGAVLLSPMVDFTFSGASMRENARRDCLLPANQSATVAGWYLGGTDPDDPRVSPLFARFEAPPPVLIQYADSEILRDDARRVADVLRAAGGTVETQVWPNAPHVFQMFCGIVPEAEDALRQAAQSVRSWLQ